MHDLSALRDLVILVAMAIPVAVVAQRFKVPTVVGFLLTGLVGGPHGLALIAQTESVAMLAEVGVVLLLFEIGLELSFKRIVKIGTLVLQAGGMQLGLTMAVVTAGAAALGVALHQGVFFGALVALSSTAIVLKLYSDRGELDTPHGRVVVAVLLFQDLAVVPLIVLVPLLAPSAAAGDVGLVRIASSLLGLAALITVGRWAVPWVLERIVGFRNREIFTLCIAFFGLGAAFVTASLGLSLAIGAFIAGLVIAESAYGVQALSDVLPFRDLFSGIFFISVGMLLDLSFVMAHPTLVLGAAAGILVVKGTLAAVVVRMLRRSWEVSILAGLGLAQVGEFSFVLASAAAPFALLDANTYQAFLGAAVLSMLSAPFAITVARPLASWAALRLGQRPLELLPHEKPRIAGLADHAILVGYGFAGRHLARILRASGFEYVVLEQNGQVVRTARRAGESIFFGDGTRREVLDHVGIERARVIVFSISAPAEERRGVAVARELNPSLHIVVRTRYIAAIDDLRALGANDVVVEEFEATLELFTHVLGQYQILPVDIQEEVEAVRAAQYGLLRDPSRSATGADPLRALAAYQAAERCRVEPGAVAVGESLAGLDLRRRTGVVVIGVIRNDEVHYPPGPEFTFRAGDTVVLIGAPGAAERAKAVFRGAGGT